MWKNDSVCFKKDTTMHIQLTMKNKNVQSKKRERYKI